MENFSSIVAKYLKTNGDKTLSQTDIEKHMATLKEKISVNTFRENSIFSYSGDVTKENITDFINKASGSDLTREVETLFAILDQDNDGSLDENELSVLKRKNGKIDSFSFWTKLNIYPDKIRKESQKLNAKNGNSGTPAAGNNADGTENVQSGENTQPADNTILSPLTQKKLNDLAQKIITGGAKLEDYEDRLFPGDYRELEALVNSIKNNPQGPTAPTVTVSYSNNNAAVDGAKPAQGEGQPIQQPVSQTTQPTATAEGQSKPVEQTTAQVQGQPSGQPKDNIRVPIANGSYTTDLIQGFPKIENYTSGENEVITLLIDAQKSLLEESGIDLQGYENKNDSYFVKTDKDGTHYYQVVYEQSKNEPKPGVVKIIYTTVTNNGEGKSNVTYEISTYNPVGVHKNKSTQTESHTLSPEAMLRISQDRTGLRE